MAKYSTSNTLAGTQQNLSSSYKTVTAVWSSNATSLRRGLIYDFEVGIDGAPNSTDCSVAWDISRLTADGTATSATPVALNPADGAMLGVSKVNFTVEGTITAASSVWSLGLNQRASFRWVCKDGGELVYPATNTNGFALRAKSATYASTVVGTLYVDEQ